MPLWKAWVPLGVLWLGVAAQFARWRQPVCDALRGGRRRPGCCSPLAGAPVRAGPRRADAAPRAARRSAARGTGVGRRASAGLVTAVARNRGWLPVANDFFMTQGRDRRRRSRAPNGTDRWSRATGDWDAPTPWSPTSRWAPAHINDVDVARAALDRGITYFDTAPDYSDTRSERVLGEAMKGQRDKVFLATKFCVADGHLPNDTPVPKIIEAVEGSLQRLQTDHVDLIHVHSCDRVERLLAPNIHEAFDRLKEQGKVRFLGVSTHTPNLEAVANAAIDSGRFDVMMLAYHFGMWPSFGHILEKAKAARRRHRRDEDAQGRQAHQPRRLPRRGQRLLAGGVPLGAVQSRRCRAW